MLNRENINELADILVGKTITAVVPVTIEGSPELLGIAFDDGSIVSIDAHAVVFHQEPRANIDWNEVQ
jgi:hypothetical protein